MTVRNLQCGTFDESDVKLSRCVIVLYPSSRNFVSHLQSR